MIAMPLPEGAPADDAPGRAAVPDTPVDALLREHAPALRRVAASYGRTPADRDDVLQDVLVAVAKAWPRFRGEGSARGFVLRVAHNAALDAVTRRGPRLAPPSDAADDAIASATTTTGSSPEVRYARREREHALLAAVRALPLGLRQPVLLLLEGLSHDEIAELLGTTANAVAIRIHRARAALRVLLEENPS